MTLRVTLDGNTFEVDGYLSPEIASMYRAWLNIQGGQQAVSLEALTEQLRTNTDALQHAVSTLSGTEGA